MKNFKLLMVFALVAVTLTVSAFATISLNFDVEEATTDSGDDCYKVVVTQTDDEGDWRAIQTKIAFNYEKIIPVDYYDGSIPSYSGESALYPFVINEFVYNRTGKVTALTTPSVPEFVINGAESEVVVELSWGYIDTYPITAEDSMIYEMYFKLADGVELSEIYEEDFNVYYVKYVNGPVFNYVGNADESLNNIVLTNNVVNEKLVEVEIPVKQGDVVYKAGSEISPVAIEENGVYKVFANAQTAGTYVVNSEYTAQKVYNVAADGTVTQGIENGILGVDEVSVRVRDPRGIRFFGTVANLVADTADFEEYGFIMTAESAYNNIGTDYVLDMALVDAGKAKKGVAKGTVNGTAVDKYFERDVESTLIAGVLYGIPMDADSVQTIIASRPYYKIGETYVYGEVTKASIYDVAKAIYNVEGFEVAWDYAKEIIDIVEGDAEIQGEIAIDVSGLYK